MPIDGINTAMTPLQFARARAGQRTVETSAGAGSNPLTRRSAFPGANPSREAVPTPPERLVPPRSFHWSYRPTLVNGKRAAKRTPQLADTDYWSFSINRLG